MLERLSDGDFQLTQGRKGIVAQPDTILPALRIILYMHLVGTRTVSHYDPSISDTLAPPPPSLGGVSPCLTASLKPTNYEHEIAFSAQNLWTRLGGSDPQNA